MRNVHAGARIRKPSCMVVCKHLHTYTWLICCVCKAMVFQTGDLWSGQKLTPTSLPMPDGGCDSNVGATFQETLSRHDVRMDRIIRSSTW